MNERNEVVLVDMKDREIGRAEKMKAHEEGWLHRAFSVFLFRGDEVLLQKRAACKYHCGGLWTNTCCSHPASGEPVLESARKRLVEEAGIHINELNELREVHSFVYRAVFANGLTEFEFDHVIVGEYDGDYILDPDEVDDMRWIAIDDVMEDIPLHPEHYTPWFIMALKAAVDGRHNKEI